MKRIYLDWASTAPPLPFVVEAQKKITLEFIGNPSSLHLEGRAAQAILEEARGLLAQTAGCGPEEIIFTSGATEANNIVAASVLKKMALSPAQKNEARIIISGIEHASLWEPVQGLKKMGFDVAIVQPEADGVVTSERLGRFLNENTVLVILMLANNETGALQPVAECASLVKQYARRIGRKIHFHTDAAQAFGKIWFSFEGLGVDSASLSAHKLGGPRGAGALLLDKQARLDFLFLGGGQEHDRRPGTENLAAIHGFALSAKTRIDGINSGTAHAARLMARLIRAIREIEGITIIPNERSGADTNRFLPHILTICVPPVPGEVLVRSLDDRGIALSTGSACHAGKKKYTRVLEAQGISKTTAASALRISLGAETEENEIDTLAAVLSDTIPLLRKISRKPR